MQKICNCLLFYRCVCIKCEKYLVNLHRYFAFWREAMKTTNCLTNKKANEKIKIDDCHAGCMRGYIGSDQG